MQTPLLIVRIIKYWNQLNAVYLCEMGNRALHYSQTLMALDKEVYCLLKWCIQIYDALLWAYICYFLNLCFYVHINFMDLFIFQ